MPRPAAARKTIRARSANLCGVECARTKSFSCRSYSSAIAPVKPCEPARYPPLQTERTVSHYCWIHMALSSASSFVRNRDECASVLPLAVGDWWWRSLQFSTSHEVNPHQEVSARLIALAQPGDLLKFQRRQDRRATAWHADPPGVGHCTVRGVPKYGRSSVQSIRFSQPRRFFYQANDDTIARCSSAITSLWADPSDYLDRPTTGRHSFRIGEGKPVARFDSASRRLAPLLLSDLSRSGSPGCRVR